jgi:formyl-CoA transferase
MTFKAISSALTGLVVIDLTGARSGPTTARQFADWGADVIRIERPVDSLEGDLGKRHGPDFQNLHRNKRSLGLDLKSAEGREIFFKLVERADVVLENFRPDVKTRLGIDYEAASKVNPRIVYGSISGFGQDGPYADRPGLDQIAQGMGGHMMITGEPGRGPMRSGAAINDVFSGILLANGVMNALFERERSGRGQWIHTSLVEAQIFLLDFQSARWTMERDLPVQEGNNHATLTPMGVFKTTDGYINIAPMPAGWPKCCKALGLDHLAADPDYATQEARRANRPKLLEIISAITIQDTSAHWIDTFNKHGVPCGPINRVDQTFADPQVQHLGIAQTVYSPAMGRDLTLIGQPLHMSRSTTCIAEPAPECGAHTVEILRDLGYTDAQIDGLEERGLILTRRK